MKTDNIFIAEVNISTRVSKHWTLCNDDVSLSYTTFHSHLKKALVLCKKNIFGRTIVKDFNNGKKYKYGLPIKIGVIFVEPKTFKAFNDITLNTESDLPKNKIKEIGNKKLY